MAACISSCDPTELQKGADLNQVAVYGTWASLPMDTYPHARRHCMPHLSAQPMASEGSRPNPKELGHVVLL